MRRRVDSNITTSFPRNSPEASIAPAPAGHSLSSWDRLRRDAGVYLPDVGVYLYLCSAGVLFSRLALPPHGVFCLEPRAVRVKKTNSRKLRSLLLRGTEVDYGGHMTNNSN